MEADSFLVSFSSVNAQAQVPAQRFFHKPESSAASAKKNGTRTVRKQSYYLVPKV